MDKEVGREGEREKRERERESKNNKRCISGKTGDSTREWEREWVRERESIRSIGPTVVDDDTRWGQISVVEATKTKEKDGVWSALQILAETHHTVWHPELSKTKSKIRKKCECTSRCGPQRRYSNCEVSWQQCFSCCVWCHEDNRVAGKASATSSSHQCRSSVAERDLQTEVEERSVTLGRTSVGIGRKLKEKTEKRTPTVTKTSVTATTVTVDEQRMEQAEEEEERRRRKWWW